MRSGKCRPAMSNRNIFSVDLPSLSTVAVGNTAVCCGTNTLSLEGRAPGRLLANDAELTTTKAPSAAAALRNDANSKTELLPGTNVVLTGAGRD